MMPSRDLMQPPPLHPCSGALVSSKRFPTFDQQNEIEEDYESGSSISRASSEDYTDDDEVSNMKESEEEDYTSTDEDDDEMSNMDEDENAPDGTYSESSDSDTGENVVKDVMPEDRRTGEELVLLYDARLKKFKEESPTLQDWLNSWSEEKTSGTVWLNVYGYCNKDKGYGGYGVILRSKWAQPIIAATSFTRGVSQFFHVLDGLKTGLELVVKHEGLRLILNCNVRKAVALLGSDFKTAGACFAGAGSSSHVIINDICKGCSKSRVTVKDATLETLIPVITKLRQLQAQIGTSHFSGLSKVGRDQNEAAHFLAKMSKRNALNSLLPKESKEIKPVDFPHKLGKILWNDAFGCDTQYSHSLLMVLQ